MNLTLGKYSIQLKRGSPPEAAARGVAEQVASSAGGLLPWPPGGVPMVYPSGNFGRENAVENLRHIRETVAACMHARSEAIGRGVFHAVAQTSVCDSLRRAGSQTKVCATPLPSDHPLERLLQHPNPIFDMSDLLELSSQWLDATGNAIWLKVRDGNDQVVELWPASVFSFTIERGADGLPETYRFLPSNAILPARDVIHIRRPDIRMSPFFGHGIISDILDTAKAETAVRLFQSRFFENDATPRAVIRWPQGALMTQDEMDRLRISWESKYATPTNAGRIGILPDGGEVQVLGSGGKELDFTKSKEELKDAIREAFRVPKIVFGDTEKVNLANADTSYMIFLRDVVDHCLAKHAQAFTRALACEFESPERSGDTGRFLARGELVIQHESLLPESEDIFMARVKELKQSMTIDEQRALIGLGPLPNSAGTVLAGSNQIVLSPN
ncbi:MAG TPA: phage portal protein [Candidatus Kapabacteria bacterium]|nr:phage portal protein [Candidatus Kapabacteria bacterium]